MIRWHLNPWERFFFNKRCWDNWLAIWKIDLPSHVSKCLNVITDFQFKNKTALSLWNGGKFQSLTPKSENVKEKATKLDCIKT